MKNWRDTANARATSSPAKSATSRSRTAAACASRSPSRTPTSSGCPAWASRRSTGSSTTSTMSCASGCSCRRSRSWPRSSTRGAPLLTLESQTPVRDFDVLAFSVSFEWDYTNVVTMLRLAGLAPRAADRDRARSARRDRRRRDVREPRAAGAVRRRDRRGRRGDAHPRPVAGVPQRPTRPRRPAAPPGARAAASTSRRSTTSATPTTARSPAFEPKPGTGAPPVVKKAAVKSDGPARSAGDVDLHARHRVRLAVPDRSRARLRQPVPLLLGGLQLPAGARVPGGSHPRARRRGARAFATRRPGVDRALRSSRRSSASCAACSTWATRSARRRCGSTT